MWRELKKIIQDNSSFIITTHVNPDGDGVGAACALFELLKGKGKKARILTPDPIPRRFEFLDKEHVIETYSTEHTYCDAQVLIVLDTHQLERVGKLKHLVDSKNLFIVCIDHHPLMESFADMLIVDDKACSVGAMVYTLFKESGIPLNLNAAEGIYTSVICVNRCICSRGTC